MIRLLRKVLKSCQKLHIFEKVQLHPPRTMNTFNPDRAVSPSPQTITTQLDRRQKLSEEVETHNLYTPRTVCQGSLLLPG